MKWPRSWSEQLEEALRHLEQGKHIRVISLGRPGMDRLSCLRDREERAPCCSVRSRRASSLPPAAAAAPARTVPDLTGLELGPAAARVAAASSR